MASIRLTFARSRHKMNQVVISQAQLPFSPACKGHKQAKKSTSLELEHHLLSADAMSWLLRACFAVAGK